MIQENYLMSPPKYKQLSDYIYLQIQNEVYQINSKIESEEAYAKQFNVSRGTVRQAIKDLEKDGIVEIIHGKGTFVKRKSKQLTEKYISFLIPDDYGFDIFHNSFYMPILTSLEKIAKLHKIKIIFTTYSIEKLNKDPKEYLDYIGNGCFLTRNISKETMNVLNKSNIPYVFIGTSDPQNLCNSVMADNLQGAYLATRYLLDLGHKKILHLTHDLSRATGQLRFEGYCKALKEYGIPFDQKLVIECSSRDYKNIRDSLDSFMKDTDFTAVFAGSDHRAIVAMDYFKEKGYRIPEDFSIVGFDNISLSSQPAYSLTTIEVNKELMAQKAMDIMLSLFEESHQPYKSTIIPVSLITRESSRKI